MPSEQKIVHAKLLGDKRKKRLTNKFILIDTFIKRPEVSSTLTWLRTLQRKSEDC